MTGWSDGYLTDVVYTRTIHRETTPVWLATTAVLTGHQPPDLTRPFRYADLGCGHGLTATVVAATCPHAEVWGFDFNPAHIESARRLASQAGLSNLHFQEASFADLAALPKAGLPAFDFIVSHGVMSWISVENRARLIDVIGQRLGPGGVAYISYNVATGWASMVPVRGLMRSLMLSSRTRSDQASLGVLDYLNRLKEGGAGFFAANPTVAPRLDEIRKQDPRYIAHEFLNADWQPLMFADVAAAMEGVKCGFIGSATLPENINLVSVPQSMMGLVSEATDPVLRETLKDFGLAQMFRRDVYRRGVLPLTRAEHLRLVDAVALEWSGQPADDPISLKTPLGTMQGVSRIYDPLMALLQAGSQTIGSIRATADLADRPVEDMVQAISLAMSSGYIHPALPETLRPASRAGADRLNAAICACNADGEDIGFLAAGIIGSTVPCGTLESLVVRECREGSPPLDILVDRVQAALAQSGRSVQREGAPVSDSALARVALREQLQPIVVNRLPLLARLGVGA